MLAIEDGSDGAVVDDGSDVDRDEEDRDSHASTKDASSHGDQSEDDPHIENNESDADGDASGGGCDVVDTLGDPAAVIADPVEPDMYVATPSVGMADGVPVPAVVGPGGASSSSSPPPPADPWPRLEPTPPPTFIVTVVFPEGTITLYPNMRTFEAVCNNRAQHGHSCKNAKVMRRQQE